MLDKTGNLCYTMYVIKRNESEEKRMDVREKAIMRWGFEDYRTLAVCAMVEDYGHEQAENLFNHWSKKKEG